jgi:outer membrane protein assembly factor BamA
LRRLTFSGSLQMPQSEQERIADAVKQATHRASLEDLTEEALERARAGWQDRGYFKVLITGETKILTATPVAQRIALGVHVDEGQRYNLKSIRFKNNQAMSDVDVLRRFFPISDGDIFSREKIVTGLENLRKAYGESGYINFTPVPDTQFDDERRLISLVIDVDEGKQFRVGDVRILGLDESDRRELLTTLPHRGEIFSSKIWEKSLLKYAPKLPDCDCDGAVDHGAQSMRDVDEKTEIVNLTYDFRTCSAIVDHR